jgi:hypothetical protein
MDARNPQGLLWLFVLVFAGLLLTILPELRRRWPRD